MNRVGWKKNSKCIHYYVNDSTDDPLSLKLTRIKAVRSSIKMLNQVIGKTVIRYKTKTPEKELGYKLIPIEFGQTTKCYGLTKTTRYKKEPHYLSKAKIIISSKLIEQEHLESTICHEMGHSLGLGHVLRPPGKKKGSTKEMMEVGCGARLQKHNYQWLIGERTIKKLKELSNPDGIPE